MDEVILARHGESELSVVGTVNGDPAVACALTGEGEEQARRLGERLAEVEIDLCVTSEFERAQRTADLALAGRNIPRLVSPGLNDVRFGSFEGRPPGGDDPRRRPRAADPLRAERARGDRSGTAGGAGRLRRAVHASASEARARRGTTRAVVRGAGLALNGLGWRITGF